MTRDELTTLIRAAVKDAGSQRALARKWDVSPSYVTDLLRGLRDPGPTILDAMGLERIIMYQEKPKTT